MKRLSLYLTTAKIPLDFLSAVAALWLAWEIRPITDLIPLLHSWFDPRFIPPVDAYFSFTIWAGMGFMLISAILGAFRFEEHLEWSKEIPRVLLSSLFWGMGIVSVYYLLRQDPLPSRMMLVQAMVFVVILSLLTRLFLRSIQKYLWKKGKGVHRVFVIGSQESQKEFEQILKKTPPFSFAGSCALPHLPQSKSMDEVWLLDPNVSGETEKKIRNWCFQKHKIFRFVPRSAEHFAQMDLQIIGGIPVIMPLPTQLLGWGRVFKRTLDIFATTLLLIALTPLFVLLTVGIKISSSGPIFYGSTRIGRNGKRFTIWKFRSMVANAEKLKKKLMKKNHRDGPFFKMKNDPRITKFGRFIRRYSLDELPQLWNVLKGDMSLIAPRAHLPEEIKEFSPELKRILSIRPGISGLAQVSGRSDLTFSEEMQLDLYYLENWSFWMDMKIFFKTIGVVLQGNGAD